MYKLLDRVNKNEYRVLDTDDDIVTTCTYDEIIYCIVDLGAEVQGLRILRYILTTSMLSIRNS